MINNLSLLTINEFIDSQDPTLDKEIVTLIDQYSGELVNFKKHHLPVPANGRYLYRTKVNSDESIVYYKRIVSHEISIKIAEVYGDGNTDDSHAIQQLIDEMETGQVLHLDNKRYMLHQPLQINKAIKIKGSATKSSVSFPPFLITNNNDGIMINTSGAVLEGFGIYNIIWYTMSPNGHTGVKVNGSPASHAYDIILRDLTIRGYQTALDVNYLWSSQIQTVKTENCKVGILVRGQSVNNEISNNTSIAITPDYDIPGSRGIWFEGTASKEGWRIIDTFICNVYEGIYAENTSRVSILNSMIDFCRHVGIGIAEDCNNWNINSNYIALRQPGYGICLTNHVQGSKFTRGNKILDNDIVMYDHPETDHISIGINIAGKGSLYDDLRGNSVKGFKVYDIQAASGLKTTISYNKCLSEIHPNIMGNFITNDNVGTVYEQNLNDSLCLGKVNII
ncbi:MAG: glycoside hydrolase family 55 protein [Chryseobacterium sp.]|uniref:right-handed parallel beta-helix repeat-containing protein n=1 Tax=Chryseobacterium sp. TaxID=1871047 RepID=UPI0025BA83A2|nr:right-handed parallel beta-helix repeat-containing protein [Chryseobacterium sp.]MCJ7932249.1 glycoside hydrolase family 55 protein [Chryseobacterium sp.]